MALDLSVRWKRLHLGWKIAGGIVLCGVGLRVFVVVGGAQAGNAMILLLLIAALLAPGYLRRRRLAQRREDLTARFGLEIARAILGRSVWQGQTEEMLLESRGAPARVDEDVLKTKVRRNYKYEPRSRGFAMTVKVENGVVVGWEDKR